MRGLLDQISTWIHSVPWNDTRVLIGFLLIELSAGGYLIWWATGFLRVHEPDEVHDDPGAPQQPETDAIEPEELEPYTPEPGWFGRLWARVKPDTFEGVTEDSPSLGALTSRRGRISGDMDSLVDRADWHDRLRDVAVRFEEALDVNLLAIAERFGCYDEMLQALADTHVHIPDSVELDDAAAPIVELLEADTMIWTAADQAALDEMLREGASAK